MDGVLCQNREYLFSCSSSPEVTLSAHLCLCLGQVEAWYLGVAQVEAGTWVIPRVRLWAPGDMKGIIRLSTSTLRSCLRAICRLGVVKFP